MNTWNGLQVLVINVVDDYAIVLLPDGSRASVPLAEIRDEVMAVS